MALWKGGIKPIEARPVIERLLIVEGIMAMMLREYDAGHDPDTIFRRYWDEICKLYSPPT